MEDYAYQVDNDRIAKIESDSKKLWWLWWIWILLNLMMKKMN